MLYALTVVALANSLLFHLGDTIIGPDAGGDNAWYAWSLWDFRQAMETGRDPAHTHNMFALLPSVQIFVDGFFDAALAWPMQAVMSPLAAYNILVLLGFVLTGLTMYLLVGEFVANRIACFIAGFLYDFSTFHFAHAAGHLGLTTMQWLPYCAWRTVILYRRPTVTNAALAGLGLALVALSEIYFLAYFAFPFLVLFAGFVLIHDRRWFLQRRNLLLTAFALLLAAAIAVPPLGDYLNVDADVKAAASAYAAGSIVPLSADLVALLVPFASNPVFGGLTMPVFAGMQGLYPVEEAVFLGYPALVLGVLALIFRRNRTPFAAFWAAVAVVGTLLALGPELLVAGHTVMPLPFYGLFFGWPVLSTFRVPGRLSILPLMALCVLAAYAIEAVVSLFRSRFRGRVALVCSAVALLAAGLATQVIWSVEDFATASLPVSPLYRDIAQDSRDGLLLDIPITPAGKFEYYQTVHHKRMVAGYAPRVTTRMTDSVFNVPYLSAFDPGTSLEMQQAIAQQGDIYAVSGGFRSALANAGIDYLVLHRDMFVPAVSAWAEGFLRSHLGPPTFHDDDQGILAWRVIPSSPRRVRLALGSGWLPGLAINGGHLVRTVQQDGAIVISAPRAGQVTLAFRAFASVKPLTMVVSVNNVARWRAVLQQTGTLHTVALSRVPIRAGRNVLTIHAAEGCARPHDVNPVNTDTRCFAFGVQQVTMSMNP